MRNRDLPFYFINGTGRTVEVEVLRIDRSGWLGENASERKSADFIFKFEDEYFRSDIPHYFKREIKEQIYDDVSVFGSCKIRMILEPTHSYKKDTASLRFDSFV